MFALGLRFAVPNILFAEELEEQHAHLLDLGLETMVLSAEILSRVEQLASTYRKPSRRRAPNGDTIQPFRASTFPTRAKPPGRSSLIRRTATHEPTRRPLRSGVVVSINHANGVDFQRCFWISTLLPPRRWHTLCEPRRRPKQEVTGGRNGAGREHSRRAARGFRASWPRLMGLERRPPKAPLRIDSAQNAPLSVHGAQNALLS